MHTETLSLRQKSLEVALHSDWTVAQAGSYANCLRSWFLLINKHSGELASVEIDEVIGLVRPFPLRCFE